MWAEAEYESLDTHAQAWNKARGNDELRSAFRTIVPLTAAGSVHDYPWTPATYDTRVESLAADFRGEDAARAVPCSAQYRAPHRQPQKKRRGVMTVGELAGLGAILADEALTGGAYELFEARPPKGLGPPMHIHREREEAFYVVSGRFTIVCDGRETDAGPGEFVMVPRGSPHGFEANSEDARLVFIVSPPGLEGFFRDGAELRATGRPDMEVREELAKRYDSHPAATP